MNDSTTIDVDALREENARLQTQVDEFRDLLGAIRRGDIDALVTEGDAGPRLLPLDGAEAAYRRFFEEMSEGVAILNADLTLLYANRRLAEMLAVPLEKVIGSSLDKWLPEPQSVSIQTFIDQARTSDAPHREEFLLKGQGNTAIPVLLSATTVTTGDATASFTVSITNLQTQKHTEALSRQLERTERGRKALLSVLEDQQESLKQISWLANHDALTHLANRTGLDRDLTQAIKRADDEGGHFALLRVDLDHFKNINDTLGHHIGDQLLSRTGERLKALLGAETAIARQGGDEFMVLLESADREKAVAVAEELLEAIRQPIQLEEHDLVVSASIGIARYPDDSADRPNLHRHADIAMYRAKALGRNNYAVFEESMQTSTARMLRLDSDLRHAISHDELELYYQPQVSLLDGAVNGLEALLRWNHPSLGQISPVEFIPIAENGGHIVNIGDWVMRAAARQYAAWREMGLAPPNMAINLSARQLRQRNIVGRLAQILHEEKIDPSGFELELTESVFLEEQETVIGILNRFAALGVHLAIDDFGTGYSSLSYLKRLPMDRLKIDKSFVDDMLENHDNAIIVRSITALGHSLGMSVLAEGVERAEQLDFLRTHHCNDIQGFIFSKPQTAAAITELLAGKQPMQLLQERTDYGKEKTLLLVDDEPGILNALKRVLRHEGYRIATAGNGEEALEVMVREDVQVIISDQRMPGMSGTEFLSRVKERNPEAVRIILSGYTDLETVTEAVNRGDIYRFLTKPWEENELRATLRDAFQRHGLFEENRRLARELREVRRQLQRASPHGDGAGN